MDFCELFKDTKRIYDEIDTFCDKIIPIYNEEIKEPNSKSILQKLISNSINNQGEF